MKLAALVAVLGVLGKATGFVVVGPGDCKSGTGSLYSEKSSSSQVSAAACEAKCGSSVVGFTFNDETSECRCLKDGDGPVHGADGSAPRLMCYVQGESTASLVGAGYCKDGKGKEYGGIRFPEIGSPQACFETCYKLPNLSSFRGYEFIVNWLGGSKYICVCNFDHGFFPPVPMNDIEYMYLNLYDGSGPVTGSTDNEWAKCYLPSAYVPATVGEGTDAPPATDGGSRRRRRKASRRRRKGRGLFEVDWDDEEDFEDDQENDDEM